MDSGDAASLLLAGLVALAFVLGSASKLPTWVLEGYHIWPPALKGWAEARHRRKCRDLETLVAAADDRERECCARS